MASLMLASAVLDCVAVGVVAWFVRRAWRDRDAALALHRGTIDCLRAEVVELVRAAEERAQALAAALDGLVAERARFDAGPPPDSAWPPRLGVDPAEARLLSNLQRAVPGVPPRA